MPETPHDPPRQATGGRLAAWIALALVLVAIPLLRQRWLDVPLDRDEGEYAYIGQLMLRGVPPYAEAYNMKLPGIYAAYAAVMWLFGETTRGIHQGLVLVNVLAAFFAFLLGRRLLGQWGGVATAAAFGLLSLSIGVQGASANSEHFVILPALIGLWLVLAGLEGDRKAALFPGALFLGLAFVVKQHGIAFCAFGALMLAAHEWRRRPRAVAKSALGLCLFGLAMAAPYLLTCLWLWSAGVFDRFWLWTVEYARDYAGQRSLGEGFSNLWRKGRHVLLAAPGLWGLALIGLSAPIWDHVARRRAPFFAGFALFSFVAISPGLIYRPHYFILALPAVALLAGLGCVSVARALRRGVAPPVAFVVAASLFAGCAGYSIWRERKMLFEFPAAIVSKAMFGVSNPFAESPAIANFVRERTSPADTIAVVGSEPQIYFYSGRRAATGYVYTYALMEAHAHAHDMQLEMISQIEEAQPKILLHVKLGMSWLANELSDTTILAWADRYTRAHYELVGLMEIAPVGWRLYHGMSLAALQERPQEVIEIYQRRP